MKLLVLTILALNLLLTECQVCQKGYTLKDDTCVKCKEGTYSLGNNDICHVCPLGHSCYYTDEPPKICERGFYQDQPGQVSCKACRKGEYQSNVGSSSCNKCPPGHYCFYSNLQPIKCKKGYYQNNEGQAYCKQCPKGYFQSYEGSTSCNICPVGHACYFFDSEPKICERGFFQDQPGRNFCKQCKPGQFQVYRGSSNCSDCPVGHECEYDSAPKRCRKGFYQDKPNSTVCKPCKAGEFQTNEGSTFCNVCPPGHSCFYNDSNPRKCKAGTYAQFGSNVCRACPPGLDSYDVSSTCTINVNFNSIGYDYLRKEERSLPDNSKNLLSNIRKMYTSLTNEIDRFDYSDSIKQINEKPAYEGINEGLVSARISFIYSSSLLRNDFVRFLVGKFSKLLNNQIPQRDIKQMTAQGKSFLFGGKIEENAAFAYGLVFPIEAEQFEIYKTSVQEKESYEFASSKATISYSTVDAKSESGVKLGKAFFEDSVIPENIGGFLVGVETEIFADELIVLEGSDPFEYVREGFDTLIGIKSKKPKSLLFLN